MLAQTSTDWELVLVDPQPDGGTGALPEGAPVRVVHVDPGGAEADAVATGLACATGRWVTVLSAAETVTPDAFERMAATLADRPDAGLAYSDALVRTGSEDAGSPVSRPEWSPSRLLGEDWLGALWMARRDLLPLDEVAGWVTAWRLGLLLVVGSRADDVVHLPEPLALIGSDRAGSPVPEDERAVVTRLLQRWGRPAEVTAGPGGTRRIRRTLRHTPLVSVVIPTRASAGTVFGEPRTFVLGAVRDLVERTTYAETEIILVVDAGVDPAVLCEAERLGADRVRIVDWDAPFSFSGKMNLGVAVAQGPFVLALNDDVQVIDPWWLEAMVAVAEEPDVGMVGATLLFEDGTLQHGGHLYLGPRTIGHVGLGAGPEDIVADPSLLVERECSGVTAACALMRRERYLEVGGFSPQLPVTYNDVDLCLKIRQRGWRIVCTPARLHHFETKSRVPGVAPSEQELLARRWARLLERDDPYWPAATARVAEPAWGPLGLA